ncbi:hypothetical protein ACVW1C_000646 [Bradyrhizobium sp. USDA 4011]
MLTVYGEGRGFRVVWLLEELGLPYRLRPVDLLAVENDRDFLAINPAGFIPALQDGETIMVESIAILEYLLARHGSGSLAVAPDDPAFASYLQFLHLGEAGLAGPMNAVIVGRQLAPAAERDARVTCWARETFESRPDAQTVKNTDSPRRSTGRDRKSKVNSEPQAGHRRQPSVLMASSGHQRTKWSFGISTRPVCETTLA